MKIHFKGVMLTSESLCACILCVFVRVQAVSVFAVTGDQAFGILYSLQV